MVFNNTMNTCTLHMHICYNYILWFEILNNGKITIIPCINHQKNLLSLLARDLCPLIDFHLHSCPGSILAQEQGLDTLFYFLQLFIAGLSLLHLADFAGVSLRHLHCWWARVCPIILLFVAQGIPHLCALWSQDVASQCSVHTIIYALCFFVSFLIIGLHVDLICFTF